MVSKPSTTDSLVSVIDLSATCLELAGVEKPECVQGQSFLPILKDPKAHVRKVIFSEHNWHVYKNHERMVRFGDYLYIKNNFPNQLNLCVESDTGYPAGMELWLAHAAGKTTKTHQQVFANPCPAEELFNVSDDPHQLRNLAGQPGCADTIKKARELLELWTRQTGDTIPESPTSSRYNPPRIENGTLIPVNQKDRRPTPHKDMPGDAENATQINHPGPI